jgi:hypothetical protein
MCTGESRLTLICELAAFLRLLTTSVRMDLGSSKQSVAAREAANTPADARSLSC